MLASFVRDKVSLLFSMAFQLTLFVLHYVNCKLQIEIVALLQLFANLLSDPRPIWIRFIDLWISTSKDCENKINLYLFTNTLNIL